ncbi:MAG: ATP-dependent DNA helicase RecQ [Candidatus Rokubacteria bacterium]|nr:ATP-dependent DNA helicase RecQ [Candidatus Rokubacteria bacterium]
MTLDLDAALRRLGYDAFRRGQREAIETLLDRGHLLLVAPTGGGKSLTYQLPASLLPGTTLVISPLVSLMHDQVDALGARGVAATYLASTLEAGEARRRFARLAHGAFSLVYVAPERLGTPGFRDILKSLDCPLVAVDEAHCISEWGHDFRPEYLAIGGLLAELKPPRVLACTATATPVVRDEIVTRLGLPADTPQIVHGFARPNLALRALEATSARERNRHVDAVLAEALGRPGAGRGRAIVYAATRKSAAAEALRLAARRWRADAYHAGLNGATRDRVQRDFAEGRLEIVVATNAFGMGIDRPDVRAVVHLSPPGSIEAYYQEVGRAGRDGQDAIGLLLVSPSDLPLRRALLERGGEDGAPPDPAVLEHKWGLFLELIRWADGGSCRHDAILRYFGDEAETLAGCGRCDVCQALAHGDQAQDPDTVTLVVRKALSGVARVHERFGLGMVLKLIRGEDDPRLQRAGLTRVPTFGNLREHPDDWLLRVLRRCVAAGWVSFSGGDRPVVLLTAEGRAVMKGTTPARILLPPLPGATGAAGRRDDAAAPARGDVARGGGVRASETDVLDDLGQVVFDALRRHRLVLAREAAVPPYVIASDRTLRDIARLRPRTLDELALAHGIGSHKLEHYGDGLLRIVREALAGASA